MWSRCWRFQRLERVWGLNGKSVYCHRARNRADSRKGVNAAVIAFAFEPKFPINTDLHGVRRYFPHQIMPLFRRKKPLARHRRGSAGQWVLDPQLSGVGFPIEDYPADAVIKPYVF